MFCRLGFCVNQLDKYPKILLAIDEAANYIRNLNEEKVQIINRALNEEENFRIQLGMLYYLLKDRSKFDYKDLVLITRDNLKQCSTYIYSIISENWFRINTDVKYNLLLIIIDFLSFPIAEVLYRAIFKRMTTGNLTKDNLWLIENMVDLINTHKELMLKDKKLLALIVYTYLRLIPTHYQRSYAINTPSNKLGLLCRKEMALVMDIIYNHFDDCFMCGGRDMFYMFQQFDNFPEFEDLWSEMCDNIDTLSTNFTVATEIFNIRTPKDMIATAIPFDMETWILWTMKNVHHTSATPYKIYQKLFNKRFFSTPGCHNLRPYLIRYIVRCFYPDNEMIESTLISRWATISWLLTDASKKDEEIPCMEALIWDWLFYDVKYDCIMDIEPAILTIVHNLTEYPYVSVTLIELLVKVVNDNTSLRDKITASVRLGLNVARQHNIVKSLGPLFDVLKHDVELLQNFAKLIVDYSAIPPEPYGTTLSGPGALIEFTPFTLKKLSSAETEAVERAKKYAKKYAKDQSSVSHATTSSGDNISSVASITTQFNDTGLNPSIKADAVLKKPRVLLSKNSSSVLDPPHASMESMKLGKENVGIRAQNQTKQQLIDPKPQRLIVLKNLVGPGDLSNARSLCKDVEEKCAEYGKVDNVNIYVKSDLVKAFVLFLTPESAETAIQCLNGCNYGNRLVTAEYYDQNHYAADNFSL